MKRRRPRSVLRRRCEALFAIVALGVLAAGCDGGGGGAKSPEGPDPLVGKTAPEFNLPAQMGDKRASLTAAQGKVVLVDFWATWCGPCKASFPSYEALSKKYGDDLVVIGISEDDDPDGIRDFAKETGATFTLAWDAQKRVAAEYHPESMPTSYLVDKDGVVRFVHGGFREGDDQLVGRRIDALLK